MKITYPQKKLYTQQWDEPVAMLGQIASVLEDLRLRLQMAERLFQSTEDSLRKQGFPAVKMKLPTREEAEKNIFAKATPVVIGFPPKQWCRHNLLGEFPNDEDKTHHFEDKPD